MKRASYREACAWVAENDSSGEEALDQKAVSELVTTLLVADIFAISVERVARDVVRYRKTDPEGRWKETPR